VSLFHALFSHAFTRLSLVEKYRAGQPWTVARIHVSKAGYRRVKYPLAVINGLIKWENRCTRCGEKENIHKCINKQVIMEI